GGGDAGQRLHPVPFPRGGGQRAHQRRPRSLWQDPRVQVLRGSARARGGLTDFCSTPRARREKEMSITAYIALGSNLGDRRAYLDRALEALQEQPGVTVIQVSSYYETEP